MLNRVFVLTFMIFLSSHVSAQNWLSIGPDDFDQVSFRSATSPLLYKDTGGNFFIAYVDIHDPPNKKVIIKKKEPSGWLKFNELPLNATHFSLGADTFGSLYVAFDTLLSSPMIMAKKFDGSNWTTLGSGFSLNSMAAANIRMKVNNSGSMIILNGLAVIKYDGNLWSQVGNPILTQSSYNETDIAISNTGTIYIAYKDAIFGDNLSVSKFDGLTWVNVGVPGFGGPVAEVGLELQNDTPVVASSYHTSVVRKFDGVHWNIVGSGDGIALPRLMFDTIGNIYLAGIRFVTNLYVYRISGGVTTLASIYNSSKPPTLALDPQGDFNLAWIDFQHGDKIRVQKWQGNSQTEEYPVGIPPFDGSNGKHSTVADHNGNIYIYKSNTSGTGGIIKYNSNDWNLTGLPVSNSTEVHVTVDTVGDLYSLNKPQSISPSASVLFNHMTSSYVGSGLGMSNAFGSAVFDNNNKPYVAIVDQSSFGNYKVRVKTLVNNTWVDVSTSTPLISTLSAHEPVLWCDSANNISVLYRENNNQLILQKFDGISWNVVGGTHIDTTGWSKYDLSINAMGVPYVVFLQSMNGLKKPIVKKFDGINWVDVGTPGFSFGEASAPKIIAVEDTVYIAYRDEAYKKVVVAKYDGTSWGALGQTASADVSEHPNIINSRDGIYLSYYSAGLFVKKLINQSTSPFFDCPLPSPLSIANITDTTANLLWIASSSALMYEYGINTSDTPPTTLLHSNGVSYLATGLSPGTTYYFFVRRICSQDTSAWESISLTTTNLTIVDHVNTTEVTVFPNPVVDFLTIRLSRAAIPYVITVDDVWGRTLKSAMSSAEVTFDMRSNPPGLYLVRCTSKDDTQVLKIIKQ